MARGKMVGTRSDATQRQALVRQSGAPTRPYLHLGIVFDAIGTPEGGHGGGGVGAATEEGLAGFVAGLGAGAAAGSAATLSGGSEPGGHRVTL